jgi:hypothetical protein
MERIAGCLIPGVWILNVLCLYVLTYVHYRDLVIVRGEDVVSKHDTDAKSLDAIERSVLHAFEVALDARLRGTRRLKSSDPEKALQKKRSMSRVDMAYNIFRAAVRLLHIS